MANVHAGEGRLPAVADAVDVTDAGVSKLLQLWIADASAPTGVGWLEPQTLEATTVCR